MSIKSELTNLIASGDIKNAIGKLLWYTQKTGQNGLSNSIILVSARYNRNKKSSMQGIINNADFNIELAKISNALTEYINSELKDTGINTDGYTTEDTAFDGENQSDQKSVFISYSHSEKEYAKKVIASLEDMNVKVIIDSEVLSAGSDIRSFIDKSLSQASNTVAIISSKSLVSSWVSIEVIKTMLLENIANKKFIAAYIDASFFERSFTSDALDIIEIEIRDINKEIDDRRAKGRNFDDLNSELKRYKDLEYNLPAIIERLKESYTVDIRDAAYEAGIKSIFEALI